MGTMTGGLASISAWASTLTATSVSEWLKALAIAFGGVWALITFRRNNRIKAAELLLKLEEECRQCLPTLLNLEYPVTYTQRYKAALATAVQDGAEAEYSPAESDAIDEVEQVLRHLHTCRHVRHLGVDAGALDDAYSWNLKLLVSGQRPELGAYANRYWPNVFFWAERVGEPWPRRALIQLRQVRPRLAVWWRGVHP